MRRTTLLAALVVLNFMTAAMGLPLAGDGGKFSASNIAPVLFVVAAGVFFFTRRHTLDRRIVAYLLAFNLGCVASFIVFLLRYSWDPNFPVLLFQDLEIAFCLLLWWYGTEEPLRFRTAVRIGIFCSIPVLAAFAWADRSSGLPWMTFGMDDKSQAAVWMCCEAYILVRFFGGWLDRGVAVALYIATFLTVSRMPVFFFPPILLALMRGSRYAPITTVFGTCIAIAVLEWKGEVARDVFTVYDRLSSVDAVADADSTTAHLALLKLALQMKFSDPLAFLFGIGPGNFAKALVSFPLPIESIQAADPEFVAMAREGRAPLHSTQLQVLLDYSFVVYLLFVYAVMRILRYLRQRGNFADLAFFAGLLLASTFYSLHNKPYIYLVVASVALLIVGETEAARERDRLSPYSTLPA